MGKKNIYFFIGTTAELIKLAPVIRELRVRRVPFKIISSNQNVLNFGEVKSLVGKQKIYYKSILKPTKLPLKNEYLNFFFWAIKTLGNFILYFNNEFNKIDKKNSFLIVHGDTVSSLIGAIAAKICRINLVHIESGLRSFNFFEPFPEEFCRFIVSNLANIHFCPNSWAVKNLRKVGGIKINTLNNTLIESLQSLAENSQVNNLALKKKFFLLILHRQENLLFKKSLTKNLLRIFTEYVSNDLNCVLVLHKLTKNFIKKEHLLDNIRKNKNIMLIPRVPYPEFVQLMRSAEFIATDGGSNQEESYYLGKPCLILRNVTERIEGLGENVLLSHSNEKAIREFILNYKLYKRRSVKITTSPSKIIVDYLIKN